LSPTDESHDVPRTDDERPFAEPWEAQAFALVLHLHEGGLFSWSEWTTALAGELERQDVAAAGDDYYRCWLAALEGLLARRGIVAGAAVDATAAAWRRAARATPHGRPIELANDPERGRRP